MCRWFSSRTIENNLRSALRQSQNIVLDLRRMDGRIPTAKHLQQVKLQFCLATSIKSIIVITREEKSIVFSR
jgi:hypothetical protein